MQLLTVPLSLAVVLVYECLTAWRSGFVTRFIGVPVALVAPAILLLEFNNALRAPSIVILYATFMSCMSYAAFCYYSGDKLNAIVNSTIESRNARKWSQRPSEDEIDKWGSTHRWSLLSRVPEKILLAVSALGGWPGAIAAQQLLRHKSTKHDFQRRFRIAVWEPAADGPQLAHFFRHCGKGRIDSVNCRQFGSFLRILGVRLTSNLDWR